MVSKMTQLKRIGYLNSSPMLESFVVRKKGSILEVNGRW